MNKNNVCIWSGIRQFKQLTQGVLVTAILLASLLIPSYHLQAAEQTWTLNFKETEIQELIRFVADATGKTMVIDPQVKGKVKVISSKAVNTEELYQLFLSILEVHGFAAIEFGDVVRVVPQKDARTMPVPVVKENGGSDSSEVITHVIQLENISAAKLIPILRPLVPQQSHMAAYAPSNAIIIADTAANISRIKQVIKQIDQTAVEQTDVISLKYASAEDVVRILSELTTKQIAKAAGGRGKLNIVADKRTNRILVSGDELSRQRIRSLVNRLDSPARQQGNARVLYLEYANAVDLAGILTKVIQNIAKLGPDKTAATRSTGTIEADEATNALIITAEDDVRQSLEAIVARLDIRRAQVLVEAIIVEMRADSDDRLGIEWLYQNQSGAFGASATAPRGLNSLVQTIFGDDDDDDDDSLDLGDSAGVLSGSVGQSLGIIRRNDDGTSFAVLIQALKAEGNSNILSTPSLLTLDNSTALITVGQEVPFVTGSFTSTGTTANPTDPFQTIERENVGILLEVTPHVNAGDSVVLEIVQEVSSLTPASTGADIITNERRIETTVMAKDREIIVLGGLIEDDVRDSVTKVPFLGDIPWLGRLFRSNTAEVTKTNLMVFIRATIIRDDEVLAGASAEKYRFIRDQQLQRYEHGIDLLDDETLPILPEWEERLRSLSVQPKGQPSDSGPVQQPVEQPAEEQVQ